MISILTQQHADTPYLGSPRQRLEGRHVKSLAFFILDNCLLSVAKLLANSEGYAFEQSWTEDQIFKKNARHIIAGSSGREAA
jgi:hypothetical protein